MERYGRLTAGELAEAKGPVEGQVTIDRQVLAQSSLPNPYRPVKGLADGGGPFVPGGEWASRPAGPPASVYIDTDGESLWAVIRCDETSPVPLASGGRFGIDCLGPDNKIKNIDTIFKFDPKGKVVKSFGRGMFIWPHGLHVDREGDVWVTDAASSQAVAMAAKAGVRAGHQVFKFSPDGKLLMTLGEAGAPGNDPYHFTSPSAVAVAANGDIFVADGHEVNGNNRAVRYSKDGKFVKAWGKTGYAPGEFTATNTENFLCASHPINCCIAAAPPSCPVSQSMRNLTAALS